MPTGDADTPAGAGVGSEIQFSGIDGTTGEPATPPLSFDQIGAFVRGDRIDLDEAARLRSSARAAVTDTLGVIEGVDRADLAQAGWGVIFSAGANPAIIDALKPLMDLRRSQAASKKPGRYRQFVGPDGLAAGERESQFLVRHGIAPGSAADPDQMPYYLLLVGGPEAISFEFQYQLDAVYSVGRLAFESPEEYARYAAAAVAAEEPFEGAPGVAFFGPHHRGDEATALSADHLVAPLAARLAAELGSSWAVSSDIGPPATKGRLLQLLGSARPAVLMTAGHGMVFPSGNDRQRSDQGALLCQDWPGKHEWSGPIPADFYASGADLAPDAGPTGMIALLFACYGAGTPGFDDYLQSGGSRKPIAPAPFVSRFAQAMLAHPAGPALAVVGHVERAMSYSFAWPGAGEQLGAFDSVLRALAAGQRVGAAMEHLNARYLVLTAELDDARQRLSFGEALDPSEVAGLWTARNDARNYVILGDPAVRHVAGPAR
jgi:hypothetical protein